MCLVSYTPTRNGFILCSNRDESPTRSATELIEQKIKREQILFPKDTQGGSWIFCSNKGTVLCILNGAFLAHKRQLPYRLSRGIMMKEYYQYDSTAQFLQYYNFENIEPFTMIIAKHDQLIEYRWDGIMKHIQILNNSQSYNWSSATLYTPDRVNARNKLFQKKLKEASTFTPETLKEIHLTGNLGNPEFNFRMSYKDRVRTISFTSIHVQKEKIDFHFNNLEQDYESNRTLKL